MRIDVRNMEPPQPMIRVVQVLEKLQEGDVLEVLGSRPFTQVTQTIQNCTYFVQPSPDLEGRDYPCQPPLPNPLKSKHASRESGLCTTQGK
jgi:hypothetical protein